MIKETETQRLNDLSGCTQLESCRDGLEDHLPGVWPQGRGTSLSRWMVETATMAAFVDGHRPPEGLLGSALPCSGMDLKSPSLSWGDILSQASPSIAPCSHSRAGFEPGFLSKRTF